MGKRSAAVLGGALVVLLLAGSCATSSMSPVSQVSTAVIRLMGLKNRPYGPSADDRPEPPRAFSTKYQVQSALVNGRPLWTLAPAGATGDGRRVLFLHGGAYAANFYAIHWSFIGWMVDQAQVTVVAPDYALVPEGTASQALAVLVALWKDLLLSSDEPPLVMGDSAGGGLALAFAMELRRQNLPQPERLVLLSPWLEVELNNPEVAAFDARDPMLSAAGLRQVGLQWAVGSEAAPWQASPLRGELGGLAPMEVFTSTGDLLNPDAHVLLEKAAAAGQELRLHETPELLHDWILLNLPESAEPKDQILAWLRMPAQ